MEFLAKLILSIWILLIVQESVESAAVAITTVTGCSNCGTGNCNSCNNNNNNNNNIIILQQQIQVLQNRIDNWESNYGNCLNQCNSFETNLAAQIQKEQQDFNSLRNSCNELQTGIQILQTRTTVVTGNVDRAVFRIGACETGYSDCTVRVVRLEGVNHLWRSNFRSVNKTITEMKRSMKTTTKTQTQSQSQNG